MAQLKLQTETPEKLTLKQAAPEYHALIKGDLYWSPSKHAGYLHAEKDENSGRKTVYFVFSNHNQGPDRWNTEEYQEFQSKLAPVPGKYERKVSKAFQQFFFPDTSEIGTAEMDAQIDQLAGHEDVYMSQHDYLKARGKRSVANVGTFKAFYVDIDGIEASFGCSLEEAAARALEICDEQDVPRPSYILNTGKGLHLVWLTTSVGHRMTAPWQHTEKAFLAAFDELGPDIKVKDGARVLRLAGTVNSSRGTICRPIYINEDDNGDPVRHDFFALWKRMAPPSGKTKIDGQVLPFRSRKDRKDWKKKKPARRPLDEQGVLSLSEGRTQPSSGSDIGNGQLDDRHWTVKLHNKIISDIWNIVDIKHGGVIEEETKLRDEFLFALMSSYAYTTHPAVLPGLTKRVMRKLGIRGDEFPGYMASLIDRAWQAYRADKSTWTRAYDDPRYKASAAELAGNLKVTSYHEQVRMNLRYIVCKERRKELRRENKAFHRGQTSPAVSREERHAAYRDAAISKGLEILDHAEKQGISHRQAILDLGYSTSAGYRYIDQARSAQTEGQYKAPSHVSQVVANDNLIPPSLSLSTDNIEESNIYTKSLDDTVLKESGADRAHRPEAEHVEDQALSLDSTGSALNGSEKKTTIEIQSATNTSDQEEDYLSIFFEETKPKPAANSTIPVSADSNIIPMRPHKKKAVGQGAPRYHLVHNHEMVVLDASGLDIQRAQHGLSEHQIQKLPIAPERIRRRYLSILEQREVIPGWGCEDYVPAEPVKQVGTTAPF